MCRYSEAPEPTSDTVTLSPGFGVHPPLQNVRSNSSVAADADVAEPPMITAPQRPAMVAAAVHFAFAQLTRAIFLPLIAVEAPSELSVSRQGFVVLRRSSRPIVNRYGASGTSRSVRTL